MQRIAEAALYAALPPGVHLGMTMAAPIRSGEATAKRVGVVSDMLAAEWAERPEVLDGTLTYLGPVVVWAGGWLVLRERSGVPGYPVEWPVPGAAVVVAAALVHEDHPARPGVGEQAEAFLRDRS